MNGLCRLIINFRNKNIAFLVCLCILEFTVHAQSIPDRLISVDIKNQPLNDVLEIISNHGNFYFSYNSNILRKDSIVSITVSNKPLKQVLELLFKNRYTYRISGNYVILRLAENLPAPPDKTPDNNDYVISGYIIDRETGEGIRDASVYEKRYLQSALTDANGYFEIKLKNKFRAPEITVSKAYYNDTTVYVRPQYGQQVTIGILATHFDAQPVTLSPSLSKPPENIDLDIDWNNHSPPFFFGINNARVEKTMLGRLLLSSRQKIQSINLRKFFANRTMQASLTPGLSTQGKLSSQVINHFSVNIIGGYTGGVNGTEIAGLFNMNRKNVRFFQAAGAVNVTGGSLRGVQLAGINNTVLDSAHGFQAGGFGNMVLGSMRGVQMSGFFNVAGHDVRGAQISGFANVGCLNVSGLQMAAHFNVAVKEMNGLQLSAGVNYAKKLKGVQIGIVNIADTSEGYSIGLINIIHKGYHKLTISSNEVTPVVLGFKAGNRKLYSILYAGMNPGNKNKIYSFGYGAGSDIALSEHWWLNPELTTEYLYLGNWNDTHVLNRLQFHVSWHINKKLSFYAGPSFAAYYSDRDASHEGYKNTIPPSNYHSFKLWNDQWTGWVGASIGINIF